MIKRFLVSMIALAMIIAILFLFYREGRIKGELMEVKKTQEQQIKIYNDILREKKEIYKRKEIARSLPISDDIKWLYANNCKDCKG